MTAVLPVLDPAILEDIELPCDMECDAAAAWSVRNQCCGLATLRCPYHRERLLELLAMFPEYCCTACKAFSPVLMWERL